MQTDTYIPRRLDDLWKIGLWDADVAAPTLFFFFVGYMSSTKLAFVISLGVGLFISRTFSRIKASRHPAFAVHWAYWSLPANPLVTMAATPPSHIRRMVG